MADNAEELIGLEWIHSAERRRTDILLASAAVGPILVGTAVLATLVFIETGTNPIIVQDRIGTGGESFRQPKVRSYKSAHDFNDTFDPLVHTDRLSRIGSFARSRHFDDLVSVLNILDGDLSFWGPRPLLANDVAQMKGFLEPKDFDYWFERYRASKKGWLSPYQAWGVNDAKPNTPEAAKSRAHWDTFYIENASKELDRALFAEATSAILPVGILKRRAQKIYKTLD